MAMFPDSGVPPAEAKNSLPDVDTQGCDELWYSTSRCQPRFDPAAANAMLAEQMNLINKGEVSYVCQELNNVEHAVRYIVQRGLPQGALGFGGPNDYAATLDPILTRYNNFLTLCIVPQVNNAGVVRIDINGKGLVPVLRWDKQQLVKDDWVAGIPVIISYYEGNFYMMRAVASQIAKPMLADIDGWIRTDGNDTTGDGTANTPQKAFRTIQGAYNRIARTYLPSSLFTINLRLGIPGVYEAGAIGPYGGRIAIYGGSPYTDYMIAMSPTGFPYCINANNVSLHLNNVSMYCARQTNGGYMMTITGGAQVTMFNVGFIAAISPIGGCVVVTYASSVGTEGIIDFRGNGAAIALPIWLYRLASWYGIITRPTQLIASNMSMQWSFMQVDTLSTLGLDSGGSVSYSNVHGKKFQVNGNSMIQAAGHDIPGTIAGVADAGSGGIYVP